MGAAAEGDVHAGEQRAAQGEVLPELVAAGRAPISAGRIAARQFAGGEAVAGLRAEHGFSALVTVGSGNADSTLLFDTGASPDGLAVNAERLGIDVGDLRGVVLSHGHFDHAGGFDGLARLRGRSGLPLTVHPAVWTRRRLELPAGQGLEMPTLSRGALEREGFEVIERRQPSLLACGILITGEVDRVTGFEHGMPRAHQAWDGNGWRHDPDVIDDQALVINVRGRGLVVITGCGHAGVVNIVRHAMRLTGVGRPLALIGGFHLSGPALEPVIGPTVAAPHRTRPRTDRLRPLQGLGRPARPRRRTPGRMDPDQRRNHVHTQRPLSRGRTPLTPGRPGGWRSCGWRGPSGRRLPRSCRACGRPGRGSR